MTDVCREFYDRIEAFVTRTLGDYRPEPSGDKVIHDPIWGSVVYRGWEIQLIDSPLLQRLRDIRQLGRAELTYPAARHTRFEHSLGTAAIAARMIDKLAERGDGFPPITAEQKNAVRLAALLHDVGHCAYSHLSENAYGAMPQFRAIREHVEAALDPGVHPKPHELFSYLIIRSAALLDFFCRYVDYPGKGDRAQCAALLKMCANMVVGQRNLLQTDRGAVAATFLTDVINSDFDADKLDYTQRDSYTSGIAMTYGIERFLMKIKLCRVEGEPPEYRMAIPSDAVTTVEELFFNRNMLYVYMYRHQKVLAAESAARDMIHALMRRRQTAHPCDFLELTDPDPECCARDESVPFPEFAPSRTLGSLVTASSRRALAKRLYTLRAEDIVPVAAQKRRDAALTEAARQTDPGDAAALRALIENYNARWTDHALLRHEIRVFTDRLGFSDYAQNLERRQALFEALRAAYARCGRPVDFDVFDLHIVFPPLSDAHARFPVVERGSDTSEADRFIYIRDWSDAFNLTNWRGYVFADTKIDRRIAGPVVKAFIAGLNPDVEIGGVYADR